VADQIAECSIEIPTEVFLQLPVFENLSILPHLMDFLDGPSTHLGEKSLDSSAVSVVANHRFCDSRMSFWITHRTLQSKDLEDVRDHFPFYNKLSLRPSNQAIFDGLFSYSGQKKFGVFHPARQNIGIQGPKGFDFVEGQRGPGDTHATNIISRGTGKAVPASC
jgi:hypothetical protein